MVLFETILKHRSLDFCVYYVSINPYKMCLVYNKQGFISLAASLDELV